MPVERGRKLSITLSSGDGEMLDGMAAHQGRPLKDLVEEVLRVGVGVEQILAKPNLQLGVREPEGEFRKLTLLSAPPEKPQR